MAQLSPDHALDDQIAKLAAELQEAGEHPKSGAGVQNVFLTKAGVQKVAVRCKVENASECQIKFQDKKDWEGRALEYPSPIDDCQSSRFAHVGQKGSIGGVVYRGDDFDFLLAWSCQRSCPSDNKVYTEIGPKGAFKDWRPIKEKLDDGQSDAKFTYFEYHGTIKIGEGTSPQLEAKITKV